MFRITRSVMSHVSVYFPPVLGVSVTSGRETQLLPREMSRESDSLKFMCRDYFRTYRPIYLLPNLLRIWLFIFLG